MPDEEDGVDEDDPDTKMALMRMILMKKTALMMMTVTVTRMIRRRR